METTEKGHREMAKAIIEYDIKHVLEHYEVYIDGKFICSEDKWTDAVREAEEYLAERR
jgi:hypothetical protein